VRAVLRVAGFTTLIISGELLVSPVLTALIPSCPYPPQYFYPTGIGVGLIGMVFFWAVDLLGRRSPNE
jgi:hypothetical protein